MEKDFLDWTWDSDLNIYVSIFMKNYKPIKFEDITDLLADWRIKSRSMIIKVDLSDTSPFRLDLRGITRLIIDIYEHTKNDTLLRQIQFIGSGFIFRNAYRPISLVIPKHIKDMIIFLDKE